MPGEPVCTITAEVSVAELTPAGRGFVPTAPGMLIPAAIDWDGWAAATVTIIVNRKSSIDWASLPPVPTAPVPTAPGGFIPAPLESTTFENLEEDAAVARLTPPTAPLATPAPPPPAVMEIVII